MARTVVMLVTLLFIVALLYLTVAAARSGGVDVLTVVSFIILAMFAFGIVGALLRPPEE